MNKQEYYLTHLMEECSEVIKLCSKSIRFGLNQTHPESKETNQERIADELDDISVLLDNAFKDGIVLYKDWDEKRADKKSIKQFKKMQVSRELGTLND